MPQPLISKISVDAMSQTNQPLEGGTADIDKIMAAIASCQAALITNIDHLQTDINLLRSDIVKI